MKAGTFSQKQQEDLAQLTAAGLVANALASGDVSSVRAVLRKKKLEKPIGTAFRRMQIIQRNVRGSEAEKDNLMPKFWALRLWSGCASLFFTLNPHDIRRPLTVMLLQNDVKFEKAFSLDLSDQEAADFMSSFLQENPRRIHQAVASSPLVATRCFHWTVKLVICVLFNCDVKPGVAMDSVPAHENPGIFGHVRAYLGVVEPQMCKALRIHMLVQLLGFTHPADIFGADILPDVFHRLWYFVASICFRSTEAFARYLNVDAAMAALQREPPLPLNKKQRGMIGEVRVQASLKAQLAARGLMEAPMERARHAPMSYSTSTIHEDASVSAGSWAPECVQGVAASTRTTGNHACRADLCHKGRLGSKGFCRMMFWHWVRYMDEKKGAIAKRSHGPALQARWDGHGDPPIHAAPPLHGAPALETNHPFHFKMTPAILLGPACNHDLGILLRLGKIRQSSTEPTSGDDVNSDHGQAISAMLESMGDHEFYCATFSSKDQPHVEGLLMSLADGVRAKE